MRRSVSFLIWLVIGCGPADRISFESELLSAQPRVVSIAPADGERYGGAVVEVFFSQPLDPASVTEKSLAITAVENATPDLSLLQSDLRKGKLEIHPGRLELLEDQQTVRFTAEVPFPPEVLCGVVATTDILSIDRLPLNQTPGEGPTPFFSFFYTPDAGTGGGSATAAGTGAASLPRPAFLRLNEVFYDAAGSDTDGDLFVELYGEPEKNVTGYQIVFVRGSDGMIREAETIPSGMQTDAEGFFVLADAVTNQPGITHVLNADWVANFDPANGPDCVQLLDPDGNLVDALGYGEPLVLRAENNRLCYEGSPAPDAPAGSSLTRQTEAEDTNDNAADWEVHETPSPGLP